MSDESEQPDGRPGDHVTARAANLFDLRRIIGGLFAALGVLLTILGLTDSQAEIDKAAGVQHQPVGRAGDARLRRHLPDAGRSRARWGRAARRGRESPSGSGDAGGVDARRSSEQRGSRPGATASVPAAGRPPGGSSASTEPPKPPPTMRAPAAPGAP